MMERALILKEKEKAKEELTKRKNEAQLKFYASFQNRNEELTRQSKQEREYLFAEKKGKLSSLIIQSWNPKETVFDGVALNRKQVIKLIHSMKETDPLCKKFMPVLSSLESLPTLENLEIMLEIALDGYE